MKREISCGIVLVHSETKHILLLKSLTNLEWDLPKGHHKKSEELFETAVREVSEEVSITKADIQIVLKEQKPVCEYFEFLSPVSGNMRRVYLFLGKTTQQPIISDEHRGYMWATLEEIRTYIKFPETVECIEKISKHL